MFINNNTINGLEFNQNTGSQYFVGMNADNHTSVLIYKKDGPGVFSQDLAKGIVFETLSSADEYLNKNSDTLKGIHPILISDVMIPIYYAKKVFVDNLPVVKTKKFWMDSDAPIGKDMYSDFNEAQNSLNIIKQSVLEFYHENMIYATMATY